VSVGALSEARAKPRLRGVSHELAFYLSLLAGAALVAGSAGPRARFPTAVFALSLSIQLGISALYHRVEWTSAARQRMRRLDHAAIFVLIAGGYTPLLYLVPSAGGGHGALVAVWIAAGVGIVKSIFWAHAPKWLTALLCVGVGWIMVGEVAARTDPAGALCVGLLVASGIIYSAGAVVYALRKPDPLPHVFGYHEVFHALVILAGVCLYSHVMLVLHG
jgi:hemolysin III